MTDDICQAFPPAYAGITEQTTLSGFTMASDALTCSLLRTLAAAKPGGRFLELGTGTGISTSWILDGMDATASLISVDNDPVFLKIAANALSGDSRLSLVLSDGADWIADNSHLRFDYIFADTWHGKYLLLEQVLNMLNTGGFYIIDDMLPQPNWPEGHDAKAIALLATLDARNDLWITKQSWATGIVVAVKK